MPELHEKHNLATPTPITDGQRIYAWIGSGQVVALDTAGFVVWTRHLGVEYSPFQTRWGHGSSPTLHGDLLVLLCDHLPDSYLLALDARTGKNQWKAGRGEGRVSHSTPLVVPGPDGDELLVNSSERIDAYDVSTGKLGSSGAGFIRGSGLSVARVHPWLTTSTRGQGQDATDKTSRIKTPRTRCHG